MGRYLRYSCFLQKPHIHAFVYTTFDFTCWLWLVVCRQTYLHIQGQGYNLEFCSDRLVSCIQTYLHILGQGYNLEVRRDPRGQQLGKHKTSEVRAEDFLPPGQDESDAVPSDDASFETNNPSADENRGALRVCALGLQGSGFIYTYIYIHRDMCLCRSIYLPTYLQDREGERKKDVICTHTHIYI